MKLTAHLKKRYTHLSLDLEICVDNEIVALCGPSGSGKSTTLKMISGLVTPDEGRITLGDKVLWDKSARISLPPQKRSIGYMFQNHAIFPHMSVYQNILFGAVGLDRETASLKVESMMKHFHLEKIASKCSYEISGGEQQRVAFAMALIRGPSALLLDEPFTALDRKLKSEMRELIAEVSTQTSIPIILVTHDEEEVEKLASRTYTFM